MYYTYVLKSAKNGTLYIGWTINLKNRIRMHNSGLVRATKPRNPMLLVYYEACLSEVSAIKREKQLKTGFGRKYIKERIE